jgi:hypothetical protein
MGKNKKRPDEWVTMSVPINERIIDNFPLMA